MPNRWFRHKAEEFEQFAIDVIMGRSEGTLAAIFGVLAQTEDASSGTIARRDFYLKMAAGARRAILRSATKRPRPKLGRCEGDENHW